MNLVQRWTVPALIAVLSLASLAVTAAEWNPVRVTPTAAASATNPAPSARVIVRYKASAGTAKILSASAQAARAPQQAQALGARLGLALVDGRGMDSRTQLVHAQGISSAALAQRLSQDASVEWAVPDRRVHALMPPNDALFAAQVGRNTVSPYYTDAGQWYLRAPDSSAPAAINAVGAWDVDTTLGASQVVAVLDTGIRPEHPDLAGGRMLAGYNMISLNTGGPTEGADTKGLCLTGNGLCRGVGATAGTDPGDWVYKTDSAAHPTLFDNSCLIADVDANGNPVLDASGKPIYFDSPSSWHGTQVTSIIGADTNNGIGVAGIASAAKILPVRVLGKCGGFDSDIIDGMRWAAGLAVAGVPTNTANPARILNLSLGGTGSCLASYQSAINEVTALGVVVVVAAGNDGLAVGAPGNCSGVVTVAGLRHFGTKVGYSSLGPNVTLAAPAGNCVSTSGPCLMPIVTALNDGLTTPVKSIYANSTDHIALGTSFATPQVAGTVALMLAANPSLTSAQVSSLLQSSARAFPTLGAAPGAGSGTGGAVLNCLAPSATAQNNECYCNALTCGAGMLDASRAVAAAAGFTFPPIAIIVPASNGAAVGSSLSVQGRSSSGNGLTYQWVVSPSTAGVSFVGSQQTADVTLKLNSIGRFNLQLTVTDNSGKSAVSTTAIEVATPPTAFIRTATLTPQVGAAVTLDGTGSVNGTNAISSYLWEISAGSGLATLTNSTAASASLSARAAGTVTVKLTVTDTLGLQASATQNITISAVSTGGGSTGGSSGGGGAWTPLWSLGLLLAALALPARRRR